MLAAGLRMECNAGSLIDAYALADLVEMDDAAIDDLKAHFLAKK